MLAGSGSLCAAGLAADLSRHDPLAGALYLTGVLTASLSPRANDVIGAAALGSVLAGLGCRLSPADGATSASLASLTLLLALLWLTAGFCRRALRDSRLLAAARADLDERSVDLEHARTGMRETDRSFQLLADHVPTLFAYVDRDRRFVLANKACEELFGVDRRSVAGLSVRGLFGEECHALVEQQFESALAGLHVSFQVDLPIPFSGTRCLRFQLVPVRTADESVCGVYVLALDETESRRAEDALRDSEMRLRATLDSVMDGIITIDARGLIEQVNPAAERLFGWRAAEVVGQNVNLLMPAPWHDEHDGYIERYLGTRQPHIIGTGRELLGLRKDGTTFPLWLGVSELGGAERRFTGVLHDLSDRNRAAEELRRERDFLDNLVDVVPLIVLVLDTAGRVVRYNRYLKHLAGHALDEAHAADWFETFVPARERQRMRDVFTRAVAGEDTGGTTNAVVSRDGRERLVEWYNAPLRDASGAVTGVLATGLDVTERRQLEQEFRQAQKMEAVGRLAGGIAHDFNNLLMGVLGCCRMAVEQMGPDAGAAPFVEEIRAATERGTGLIRQLMAFSRRRTPVQRPFSVNGMVASNEAMLRQILGEDIELQVELCATSATVLGDVSQLEQVLMNLVVNARDAMSRGGQLTIRTAESARGGDHGPPASVSGPHVVLEVADTGCGMDAATRERAFEPFFTTKAEGQGTGLGLATVYGIVKQLGGHLHVDSEQGVGTTFRIHLPRSADEPAPAGREAPAPSGPLGSVGGMVLLVEDDVLVRAAARHILRKLGHRVVEAANAEAALTACDRHGGSLDLLLTDMIMPGMDGGRLALEIRTRYPQIRVIIMSAHPEEVLLEQGRIVPGQITIEKPFDEAALAACVRRAFADTAGRASAAD